MNHTCFSVFSLPLCSCLPLQPVGPAAARPDHPLSVPCLCRAKGYAGAVKYELQPYAGWGWTWGTVSLDGSVTCEYGKDCPGYLYIACGAADVPIECLTDELGNIGKSECQGRLVRVVLWQLPGSCSPWRGQSVWL